MEPSLEDYEDFVRNHAGNKAIRRIVVANNGMAATKFILSIRNWLFENFGDERLIHIIAMATPEARPPGAPHSALSPHNTRTFAGHQGARCAHRCG
jgi:hypothetical protein